MTETEMNVDRVPAEPLGHVIGFIESQAECENVVNALVQAGIDKARIVILQGNDGSERFHEMMDGSQWGEEEQRVLKEGDQELSAGHFVMCVEVKERGEASRIASVSQSRGGHGFSHFGVLSDERFTR